MTTGDELQLAEKISLAEKILGHSFADKALLASALTHPSALEGGDDSCPFERLEFLGDSVISFIIADEVFRRFPELAEGGMTRIKVSVINGSVMTRVADEFGLARALVLGESERGTQQRGLASALENLYESLTAALYLDAGLDAAREWVLRTIGPLVSKEAAQIPENPKSELQELVQASGKVPVYRIVNQSGPPHDRRFTSSVEVDGRVLGTGCGRTKKEAEAEAAAAALTAFAE